MAFLKLLRRLLHSDQPKTTTFSTVTIGQEGFEGENIRRWNSLSEREQQVAALSCLGYANLEIAEKLTIADGTVKYHMANVRQKFNVHSKIELRRRLSHWDFSGWDFHLI